MAFFVFFKQKHCYLIRIIQNKTNKKHYKILITTKLEGTIIFAPSEIQTKFGIFLLIQAFFTPLGLCCPFGSKHPMESKIFLF